MSKFIDSSLFFKLELTLRKVKQPKLKIHKVNLTGPEKSVLQAKNKPCSRTVELRTYRFANRY